MLKPVNRALRPPSIGRWTPPQIIVASFAMIIVLGTLLLMLPWSATGRSLNVIEALFTSVSATCVTGLTVLDISRVLTPFGQSVVLLLIQLGGLGLMTFSTFFLYIFGRRVSLRHRAIIDTTLSHSPIHDMGALLRRVMGLVLGVEAIGALGLTVGWLSRYPLKKALWHGLFHSVSGFCNAGFSLHADSLVMIRDHWGMNLIFMVLIILGGLGFIVLLDFRDFFRKDRSPVGFLTFHSKVVLAAAAVLIVVGTGGFYLVERHNTLAGLPLNQQVLAALFQSVTARTAGFNTLSMGAMSNAGCFLMMFLMFIGAAPGSCGGGVKVTTFGIILAMFYARLRGFEEPRLFHRRLDKPTTGKALSIVLGAVALVGVVFMMLLISESGSVAGEERAAFLSLSFETISAFGTVGLSMGATPSLSTAGRLLIIALMFIGRLGPLTLAVALTGRRPRRPFRLATGEIMVG